MSILMLKKPKVPHINNLGKSQNSHIDQNVINHSAESQINDIDKKVSNRTAKSEIKDIDNNISNHTAKSQIINDKNNKTVSENNSSDNRNHLETVGFLIKNSDRSIYQCNFCAFNFFQWILHESVIVEY